MPHQPQRGGQLGFRGPRFGTRGIPGQAIGAPTQGAEFLGLGRALMSAATSVGQAAIRAAEQRGGQEGAIAAGQATVTDPQTGEALPSFVSSAGSGAFSEAFNRQSEKIFAQRLETIARRRINELSREFGKDPVALQGAVDAFASGLKESAGVPPEMAPFFDNTVATITAPFVNAAHQAMFDETIDDAAAAREASSLARIQDARPQGRILGSGGAGSVDALDAFGKVLLQQRADLAGDIKDGVLTRNEARLAYAEFQSRATKELLKGIAEGSPNRDAIARQLSQGTLTLTLPVFDEATNRLVMEDVNVDDLLLPDDQDKAITAVNTIVNRETKRAEKGERDGEKATKEEQEQAAAVLYDGIIEGTVDDEELDRALEDRRIDGDDFRTLRRALATEPGSVDDPAVVVELEQAAADGSLNLRQVVDQFEAGTITQGTFQSFSGRAQGDVNDLERRGLASINRQVGGERNQFTILGTDDSVRLDEAFKEFREQIDRGIDPIDAADDINARYRKTDPGLNSLPRPLYLVGPRNDPDLQATRERTVQAFTAGDIDSVVFDREAELLEQLERFLLERAERAAATAAAKDRKSTR